MCAPYMIIFYMYGPFLHDHKGLMTTMHACLQVYRSSDFRTWSSSNDTLFQPAECPSLFKLPRTV
eukprot:SAG31_NODE_45470_length_258_cov_1.616352_1_plen_64_part_10